jgi:hypothetical protein
VPQSREITRRGRLPAPHAAQIHPDLTGDLDRCKTLTEQTQGQLRNDQ